ncbi:RNA polymerase sigma factor [Cytobacillus purgationiresistens]|uniref:RNA polymerase sigma-70 factor (ECF subfamily) n=1 Tax=Cytobacillus purgationiresistens TaxID=863449 RepID=A0ABU0AK75_9BACI|nr:sigma-70 family RNA polymerase sigma factor [Cytobacillus purgationiresistens]MDQ0271666.1 RNA polymerase sigma-70 factor (ECF subfamily) [Cytobacillus purgationiresistens]
MNQDIIDQRLNEMYFTYCNDVYQYLFFMVGDHELAKDLMQDTFIRAFTKIESFEGHHIKSWLFRIARNLTIDYIRKKKPLAYIIDSISPIMTTDYSPEQILLFNETEKLLYIALNNLKRSYREIIILRKLKEFSISESCEILGWTESKVK